jgi:hypothetical protein
MIISIIREDSHDPKTQKQTSKDGISKTYRQKDSD